MKLQDFSYSLLQELIAQFPIKDREQSGLLVLDRKTGQIAHRKFFEIIDYFEKGDVLILNDTKVFKARLKGKKDTGGGVEVLLVKQVESGFWEALVHSSKRMRTGDRIFFEKEIFATVRAKAPGKCYIEFSVPVEEVVRKFGIVPLPHYIKRNTVPADEETYQTVYAREEGSIAAPTAGLHFTPRLLKAIENRGVKTVYITLHIGPGTFKPIRVEDIERHRMEPEFVEISKDAAMAINNAPRVFGVGTSVTRALESVIGQNSCSDFSPQKNKTSVDDSFSGFTDLFIYPGHKFMTIDHLITNFHLPCSTPLLLVCAFAGKELIFKAYQEAIASRYRFLSYGDAMLIM